MRRQRSSALFKNLSISLWFGVISKVCCSLLLVLAAPFSASSRASSRNPACLIAQPIHILPPGLVFCMHLTYTIGSLDVFVWWFITFASLHPGLCIQICRLIFCLQVLQRQAAMVHHTQFKGGWRQNHAKPWMSRFVVAVSAQQQECILHNPAATEHEIHINLSHTIIIHIRVPFMNTSFSHVRSHSVAFHSLHGNS